MPSTSDLPDQFEKFHLQNPRVYAELRRRALALRAVGAKKGSIAQLFEVIRYDYTLQTRGDVYKLNNNYRAFYARVLMEKEEGLAGFFTVRGQECDWEPDLRRLFPARKAQMGLF